MSRVAWVGLVLTSFFVIGCGGGGTKNSDQICGTPAYAQDFVTPVGSLVIAWGNEIKGTGSGFLVNREKGIFMTADHVVDGMRMYGKASADLFFNGKVYKAVVLKVLSLDDAALVQIECSSSAMKIAAADFPDPFLLASTSLRVGDTAAVLGIHLHPLAVRMSNKMEGVSDRTLPILFQYYQIIQKDATKEEEMVFDSLPSVVSELDRRILAIAPEENKKTDPFEVMRDSANTYTHVKTVRDHKFSFGGLSGGPVLNSRGELVGIVIKERRCFLHFRSSQVFACRDVFVAPIHKKEVLGLLQSAQ